LNLPHLRDAENPIHERRGACAPDTMSSSQSDDPQRDSGGAAVGARESIRPQAFSGVRRSAGADVYLREPLARAAAAFFDRKGLAALKEEDQRERWYDDWLEHQSAHQLYARLLSPQQYSRLGSAFDLLRYARFLEVCAYFSPAHGYSLQVTFLGLSAILMGSNSALKREAIAALESGGLLAFGVSEQRHGSDLLGNEFTVTAGDDDDATRGDFVANGTKYYIGNSNCASIISILARKEDRQGASRARRAPFVLFALRPPESKGYRSLRKIGTLGVRAAFVGEFGVDDHPFPKSDVIAEGRQAWDAVFGTVTLGKFFLGFGSIGICEHAFEEAAAHLRSRVLYGRPIIEMPHIRATMAQAYARLTAMKLYAYRALDHVHAASAGDRRYLLFAAVQKARVSTEGVKVMALLSECIGAKGFESETYFEMALRDVQLIPGLEGSTHINLGLAVQFMPRYFGDPDRNIAEVHSLIAGDVQSGENPYLPEARTGAVHSIAFPDFLKAYRPLMSIANVRRFVSAAKAFQLLVRGRDVERTARADVPQALALGQCVATIAYAQLVAENAVRLGVHVPMVSAMFHALVGDFNVAVLALASCAGAEAIRPHLFRRLVSAPRLADGECDFVSRHMTETRLADGRTE